MWRRRPPKWPWRAHLTEEEARTVQLVDREIVQLKRRMGKLSAVRNPIVNRAIHRAKYSPRPPRP